MAQLKRQLTTFGLTMIAVGSCIGSGIFITPSMIAGHLPSFWSILGVWFLGGLLALAGSLSLAYLGMIFTETGGVYTYLRERYGSFMAFSYGWVILTVVTSGAIAALSLAFARYVAYLIPLDEFQQMLLAIGGIVLVTVVNIQGVRNADRFSTLFTILKLVGILGILLTALLFLFSRKPNTMTSVSSSDYAGWSAWAGAMIGIIWSYGGWHHASYVAGEAIAPEKSVPRAMIIGTLIVTLTYVAVNWAYLQLLGPKGMAASSAVASDAVMVHFALGAKCIALLIALSTFGTMGVYTLSAPRIYFAMAKDGVFLKSLARIHEKYQTPITAIVFQSAWAIILVLFWGTFESLITYVVFMDWVFMAFAVGAVFYYYQKQKTAYRIPLYPLTPLFFIVVAVVFLVRILIDNPAQGWAGLLLLAVGAPVYYFFKRA